MIKLANSIFLYIYNVDDKIGKDHSSRKINKWIICLMCSMQIKIF